MAKQKIERHYTTTKRDTLRWKIEHAMWSIFEATGNVGVSRFDIVAELENRGLMPLVASAANQISAQLSHMKNEGIVLEAGKTDGENGRRVMLYSLEAIVDIHTKPTDKTTEAINKAIQEAAERQAEAMLEPTGPPAKHINRPPAKNPSKEEFERKAKGRKASEGNSVPAETTATGLPVHSVPAHEFHHYDGNSGSGKLTTERRPGNQQDPEAIAEMVQHLKNTEGENMASGAPKHGTPEFELAERDKRIDRLADLLEKAIEGISKANREGIAKQDIANAGAEERYVAIVDVIDSLRADIRSVTAENTETFREMVHNLLKLWVESTNGQKIVTAMMSNVMRAMEQTIEETRNTDLIRAQAYAKGWADAKKESPNTPKLSNDIPVTETMNETAIRAEEIARGFGISANVPRQGEADVTFTFDLFDKD